MVTTPNYDLDIDTTLGGNNASDYVVPSQKAIKSYVDNSTGGNVMWGNIAGNLSNQTDLQDALNDKQDKLVSGTNIKTINGQPILGNGNLQTPYRNIGEIIPSAIPLTDAGLHLLDGALINGSGIYADFVTYIAGLKTDYPDLFVTENDWQSYVTTYGVCGKFVYDGVNNTVRLPKITGLIEGTTDVNALCDLVEAGLPNITVTMQQRSAATAAGAIWSVKGAGSLSYHGSSTQVGRMTLGDNVKSDVITIDASLGNPIYNNSTTVQPQTIKVLYYIVIANSTKTNIQVDIDNIVTDLNEKMNTDLTNITDTGKINIAHNAMPSRTFINLTLPATNTIMIAPADGYVCLGKASTAAGQSVMLGNKTTTSSTSLLQTSSFAYTSSQHLWVYLPVSKGDPFNVAYNAAGTLYQFCFVYTIGAESEAA